MNTHFPPDLRRAFTLTELLVVIAIIAILCALLFPTFGRVRAEGAATQCANNMRQVLAARKLYTAENDGATMPLRPAWPADPNGFCTWRYYLNQKYGVDKKAFLCPNAPNVGNEAGGGETWRTASGDLDSNFAALGNWPWTEPVRLANVTHPSQQLELFETRDRWPDLQIFNWSTVWGDGYGVFGYWHGRGRMNCGFMDGHIERKKLGQTVTPVCHWDTLEGIHDGKSVHAGDYNAMHDLYK